MHVTNCKCSQISLIFIPRKISYRHGAIFEFKFEVAKGSTQKGNDKVTRPYPLSSFSLPHATINLSLRPLKAYVAQRYSRALNHPVCVASGTAEKQGHSQGSVRLDKKNGL